MDGERISATDRIKQLVTDVANERTKNLLAQLELPENRGLAFFKTISGTNNADYLETFLKDPWTTIVAIVAYLDEKGI